MANVTPRTVLAQVAAAIPSDVRDNVIIIGSLAAGFQLLGKAAGMYMRTKDVDCMLSPRLRAIAAGAAIVEELLGNGWRFRESEDWPRPGDKTTPDQDLPAARLSPPEGGDWFIELLTDPDPAMVGKKDWMRLETTGGHFGLCALKYLSLLCQDPVETEFEICVASPAMMALGNLLEHPGIGSETMSGLIEGREIKRSNKDLGRVLAIARLTPGEHESWFESWTQALEMCFPDERVELAHRCGSGLRQLLKSDSDLEEAVHTCNFGLLAAMPVRIDELRATGDRFLVEAIEPMELS